jgi:hypothetical protein
MPVGMTFAAEWAASRHQRLRGNWIQIMPNKGYFFIPRYADRAAG